MRLATIDMPGYAKYAAMFFDALKTRKATIGSADVVFQNGVLPMCVEQADSVTFSWASRIRVSSGTYAGDVKSVDAYRDRLVVNGDLSSLFGVEKQTIDTVTLGCCASVGKSIVSAVKSKRVAIGDKATLVFMREVIPQAVAVEDHFELRWASGIRIEIAGAPDPTVRCIRVYRDRWEVALLMGLYAEVSFR